MLLCSGVLWDTITIINSSYVAYSYGGAVVSLRVRSRTALRPSLRYGSVKLNDPVVAYVAPPVVLNVPTLDVLLHSIGLVSHHTFFMGALYTSSPYTFLLASPYTLTSPSYPSSLLYLQVWLTLEVPLCRISPRPQTLLLFPV